MPARLQMHFQSNLYVKKINNRRLLVIGIIKSWTNAIKLNLRLWPDKIAYPSSRLRLLSLLLAIDIELLVLLYMFFDCNTRLASTRNKEHEKKTNKENERALEKEKKEINVHASVKHLINFAVVLLIGRIKLK